MQRPENPCSRDCPKRHAGCAVGCKDWKDYVVARNAFYIATHKAKQAYSMAREQALKRKLRRIKEGYE